MTKVCEQCHKQFTPAHRNRRFCSRQCVGVWFSLHARGSASFAWKKTRVVKSCLTCGEPIRCSPSQETTKKTCSRVCDAAWRKSSGMYAGDNNPAYKGGTSLYRTNKGQTYRYLLGQDGQRPEHRAVMEQVLGRKLLPGEEVHHINGNTLDNNPMNLYVLDKKHHSRLHFELFKRIQRLEQENKRLKAVLQKATASSLF